MTADNGHRVGSGAYETCFACRGSGVELGLEGDLAPCYVCKGACVLRRRDRQGRFTTSTDCEDICMDECVGACGV
jgi:hypothetical protein